MVGNNGATIDWRATTAEERADAIAPIRAQLMAFQRDDYSAAVTYQSSDIRRSFTSVSDFRDMIKASYPEFASFKSAEYGTSRATQDGSVVEMPVQVTGGDGVTVSALYILIKENGAYKIQGVTGGEVQSVPVVIDPRMT